MITHRLNLGSYTIGEEFKTFGGDRVVSGIGKNNEKVTFLEVAQAFGENSFISVGIYVPINESGDEQIFQTTRIISSGNLDYQKYKELYENRRQRD